MPVTPLPLLSLGRWESIPSCLRVFSNVSVSMRVIEVAASFLPILFFSRRPEAETLKWKHSEGHHQTLWGSKLGLVTLFASN